MITGGLSARADKRIVPTDDDLPDNEEASSSDGDLLSSEPPKTASPRVAKIAPSNSDGPAPAAEKSKSNSNSNNEGAPARLSMNNSWTKVANRISENKSERSTDDEDKAIEDRISRRRDSKVQQKELSTLPRHKQLWRHWRQYWCPKIFATLDDSSSNQLALWFSLFIFLLIIASSACFVLESMPEFMALGPAKEVLCVFEYVFIVLFSIEYLLKLATSPDPIRFARALPNVIDLAAILPWYIGMFTMLATTGQVPSCTEVSADQGGGATRILRILRLMRVFRLAKLSKFASNVQMVTVAITSSMDVLLMLFMNLLILVLVFASLVFYLEQTTYDEEKEIWVDAFGQPSQHLDCGSVDGNTVCNPGPSPFVSIPTTMWWGMVTATTVGYGDYYPVTTLGRFVAVLLMLMGIVFMALPITIVGTNFSEEYQNLEASRRIIVRQQSLPTSLKQLGGCLQDYEVRFKKFVEEATEAQQDLEDHTQFLQKRSKLPSVMIEPLLQRAMEAQATVDEIIQFERDLNTPEIMAMVDDVKKSSNEMRQCKMKIAQNKEWLAKLVGVIRRRQLVEKARDVAGDAEACDGIVVVKLYGCKNLVAADISGTSDPYVTFELGKQKVTSSTCVKSLNPFFDEELCVGVEEEAKRMMVTVWDQDKVSKDDKLGRIYFNLNDIKSGKYAVAEWRTLQEVKHGQIKVEMVYHVANDMDEMISHMDDASGPQTPRPDVTSL